MNHGDLKAVVYLQCKMEIFYTVNKKNAEKNYS